MKSVPILSATWAASSTHAYTKLELDPWKKRRWVSLRPNLRHGQQTTSRHWPPMRTCGTMTFCSSKVQYVPSGHSRQTLTFCCPMRNATSTIHPHSPRTGAPNMWGTSLAATRAWSKAAVKTLNSSMFMVLCRSRKR